MMLNEWDAQEFRLTGSFPQSGPHSGFGLAILIVEDHPLIALDLETMLLKCGIERVTIATSIAQALTFIEAGTFDAALLDVRAGEELTVPVAAALRLAETPFAFTTAYDIDSAALVAFKAHPVIKKPYSEHEICDVLSQLLTPRYGP